MSAFREDRLGICQMAAIPMWPVAAFGISLMTGAAGGASTTGFAGGSGLVCCTTGGGAGAGSGTGGGTVGGTGAVTTGALAGGAGGGAGTSFGFATSGRGFEGISTCGGGGAATVSR